MPPRRLLVVWWSNTGGTEAMVHAAVDGARRAARGLDDGAGAALEVDAVRCDTVPVDAVARAHTLLFAGPECLGTLAGPMKSFFDRAYYPLLDRLEGRPYAAMVCAGTDGTGALRQIERIGNGWRLRRVVEPVRVLTGAQTAEEILAPKRLGDDGLRKARELGETLGAGTALGIW
jgi:hypothetical protein